MKQESTSYTRLMEKRIAELEKSLEEQCRLNGMGGERELKLKARVAELEAELWQIKTAVVDHVTGHSTHEQLARFVGAWSRQESNTESRESVTSPTADRGDKVEAKQGDAPSSLPAQGGLNGKEQLGPSTTSKEQKGIEK